MHPEPDHLAALFRGLSRLSHSFVRQKQCRRPAGHRAACVDVQSLEQRQMLAATGIQAFHRSGQTFVTWQEDTSVSGEEYHVYRSASPITTANLGQAQKLTAKWGPVDDNTSVNFRAAQGVPANFVINDLAAPLTSNQGLFVHTTQAGHNGTWFYAVTQVNSGIENSTLVAGQSSLTTGVTESVATTTPVLTVSVNGGKGRIYTHYMDYAKWNPTFQGYAYNYSVALPANYTPGTAWPLKLMPHAYGERMRLEPESEYGWPCIQLFPDDKGGGELNYQTWWYGFAADHNYKSGGQIPTSGTIENFTEQRVLKAIDEVSAIFSVDPLRVHSQGHSMGASGSLSLGMRYANMFVGIFGSEPMTNYASSPLFQNDFTALWGSQASNLPIVSNGAYAGPIKTYDGTGVYNWMNHHQQLTNRRGDDMAFLMVGHGKSDDVIDWATQGRPFIAALNAGNTAFTAEERFGWDHNWMGFGQALDSMFSPSDGGLSAWEYPRNLSFPAITNATGSGPSDPTDFGSQFYNMTVEWSVPWNNFHNNILDTAGRYEISLRSTNGNQVAEVTPRKFQSFLAPAGTTVTWQNISNVTGQAVQSGTVVSDAKGVVTIPRFQIGTNVGNRLILTPTAPAIPVLTGPAATTESQRPTFTWNSVSGATSYNVWVNNLSTGQSSILRPTVSGTSWTPSADLGIGRYRVWVQARNAAGLLSGWSIPLTVAINPPVDLTGLPASFMSTTPQITWPALPGAVRYALWVNNVSTGHTSVIREYNLTGTAFQFPTPLALGLYAVWVRGFDAGDIGAKWSPAREMTIAPQATLLSPLLPTFNSRPTFTWQPVSGASRYHIQIQNAATGAVLVNQQGITATSFIPADPLPAADYQWWIRATGPTGVQGTWSLAGDFNVTGKPVITMTPGNTASRTPTFQWTAVSGASTYELWVSGLTGGGVVINLTGLQSTSYIPTASLAPRTYRVWVRAVSTTGQYSPWSKPLDITITDHRSPGAGARIPVPTDHSESPEWLTVTSVLRPLVGTAAQPDSAAKPSQLTIPRRDLQPAPAESIRQENEAADAAVAIEIDRVMAEW